MSGKGPLLSESAGYFRGRMSYWNSKPFHSSIALIALDLCFRSCRELSDDRSPKVLLLVHTTHILGSEVGPGIGQDKRSTENSLLGITGHSSSRTVHPAIRLSRSISACRAVEAETHAASILAFFEEQNMLIESSEPSPIHRLCQAS